MAAKLSVVIAAYNARATIRECLNSLESQLQARPYEDFEIILVDSSTDGTAGLVASEFPRVRLTHCGERKFCGSARNIGIAQGHGEIIAFIDADCVAASDWAARILAAHECHDAVGGAIGNAAQKSYVGWAAYLSEFSAWMPKTPPQVMTDVAAANMSYKRKIFDELGRLLEGTYCSDTEFHWRMMAKGYRINFDPRITVYHHSIPTFGSFVRHEIHHGQSFARVRARARNFTFARRACYFLLSPLIAAKLAATVVARNLSNKIYFRQFLASLPLLLCGVASWSLGEGLGYLGANNETRD
jgi:O-antigen biosynthesis protein